MLSKSTNRYSFDSTSERLIIFLVVLFLVECQPECSAKTFPAIVPIKSNETLVIDLQDYFQGSNISYSVIPNTSSSYVDKHFQCQNIGYQSIGRVVASQYLSRDGVEIVAILAQSPVQQGVFFFYYIQIELMTVTTLSLNDTKFRNCSHFKLIFLNSTHFEVIINCRYTPNFFTYAFVSTIAKLSTIDPVWTFKTSPLYTTSAISDMKLQIEGGILLRGVRSSTNSYVQIWNWNDQARQVIGLIDKVILEIPTFNLQQMKHYGNILVLLDFQTGLHILRIDNRKKYTVIANFLQPFYEGFDYNPSTGLIYLFKKGKTVSMIIESIEHQNLFVRESFSTFKYESILKIIEWQNRLITLGEQFLSMFSLSDLKNQYSSNIYYSQKTVNFFLRNQTEQSISLLLIQNNRPTVSYKSCRIRTPYLHLSPPETQMQITVFGSSLINGESSVCRQSFVISRLTQDQNLIYDNGYQADNQVIYSNLPGLARVSMDKFGVGKNMSYRVLLNPLSKIDYISTINKAAEQFCTLQNKTVSLGGTFYLYKAWQNVLVTQTTADKTLRYFFCQLANGVSCTSKVQIPGLQSIDLYSTETIEDTDEYSISYQAVVQQKKFDTEIIVKKVLVLPLVKNILLSFYCSINLGNRSDQFSNVTQIQIVNSRLFVVMPYRKQIRIYSLLNQCQNIANLTVKSFPGSYFAPRAIYFDHSLSTFRHQIVLIRQWDELMKVRLQGSDLSMPPAIMSRSKLPESTNGSLAVAYPYIIYLSLTNNKAVSYLLGDSNELIYLRELSLEGMKFANVNKNRDDYFQLLDADHLSINLVNGSSKSMVIKIFQISQLISVAGEYLHIPLSKDEESVVYFKMSDGRRPMVRLQLVNGPSVGYLICKSVNIYLYPSVVFNFKSALTSLQNYSQNITLSLQTRDDLHNHNFKISLANIGLAIARGNRFPARGTIILPATQLILDDTNWFSGSIYSYDFDCRDCKNRIKFQQKIIKERTVSIPIHSRVFWQQENGTLINMLTKSFFTSIQYNYSAWPIDGDRPTNYGLKSINAAALGAADCLDIKWVDHLKQIISLCWRYDSAGQKEYILSVSSMLAYKAFVIEQMVINFQSRAVPQLQLRDGVIIVYSSRLAIVLTLWQIDGNIKFIELDRVDKQDISQPICTIALVCNSTQQKQFITKKLFGLILTKCTSQIYYISFSIYLQEQEMIDEFGVISRFIFPNIHISYSQTINLLKIWSQRHIQIPSQANIIKIITKMQVSDFDEQQLLTLIVIFDRFHSFQFKVILSKYIKVIKRIVLQSIYYKFGSNIATSASLKDYLVIKYILDVGFGKLEELYGCFDLNQYVLNSDKVKQYYSFAAYRFQSYKSNTIQQDFPWELIGNKITQLHYQNLQILSINNKLIAHIDGLQFGQKSQEIQPLYTQSIIITANNPIGARSATIILSSEDQFILSGLQIGLIVFGCIVFVVVTALVGRVFILKLKKRLKLVQLVGDERAEDAMLQREEQERAGEYLINISERGSMQP